MSAFDAPNYGTQPAHPSDPWDSETEARLREDASAVVMRYPQRRSALLPLLHLVQSVDGYVSTRGIELAAEFAGVTAAEASGVATFYTQYKRHKNGEYLVGVCTNSLCAVMGGDQIWDELSDYLGVGHDETTEDGVITLERLECNAACDFAPVVMANWEFFDNMTPTSARELVDALRAGTPVRPSRGPDRLHTFKEVSRVLAGFLDGHADEGPSGGPATMRGLEIARREGWDMPRDAEQGRRAGATDGADQAQPGSIPAAKVDAQPAPGEKQSSADAQAAAGKTSGEALSPAAKPADEQASARTTDPEGDAK
ncbi:NADH-quinone oxidoreductase subunit NuoE [Arsenicicoccus dermatophilus]|uniref:NADH-quinone oxidoreductase subunit NuoE n=1 Tax=Arsenicicoccus dermatophilus TaxID=1076331 RepID=UPI001F4C7381|nr:NADH-quinone oxidoreductase subunit NuoE [Arsenicicoccus dermatophilus]MCH8613839.1 NADH-quinone oxidoreductase subunit NuoE [Arsenicicoccus dermatophilus]